MTRELLFAIVLLFVLSCIEQIVKNIYVFPIVLILFILVTLFALLAMACFYNKYLARINKF